MPIPEEAFPPNNMYTTLASLAPQVRRAGVRKQWNLHLLRTGREHHDHRQRARDEPASRPVRGCLRVPHAVADPAVHSGDAADGCRNDEPGGGHGDWLDSDAGQHLHGPGGVPRYPRRCFAGSAREGCNASDDGSQLGNWAQFACPCGEALYGPGVAGVLDVPEETERGRRE